MGKRSTKAELELRVSTIQRLIYSGANASDLIRFAAEQWGVGSRQAENYIQRARKQVIEDYSLERKDFLAQRLGILDKVVKESIKCGQYNNTIGALRLAAELTGSLQK